HARGLTREELGFACESLGLSHVFEWETASKRLDGGIRSVLTGRAFDTVEEHRATLARLSLDEVKAGLGRGCSEVPPRLVAVGDPAALRPGSESSGVFDSIEITEIHP